MLNFVSDSVIFNGKLKCIVLFLNEKLEAIKQLNGGESIRKVSNDLGIGEVTVMGLETKSVRN